MLLVASPLILAATAGIHARTFRDPFEPVGYSPIQEQRLTAYRDLTMKTRWALIDSQTTPADYDKLADRWVDSYRNGKLGPLYPVNSSDSLQDGVKCQVLEAVLMLDGKLNSQALKAAQKGDAQASANLFITSMDLCEVLKYSDFIALGIFRREQNRILKAFNGLPTAPRAARLAMAASLTDLLKNQGNLDHLATLSRLEYLDSQRQAGLQPVSIQDPSDAVAFDSVSQRYWLKPAARTLLASRESTPRVYSEIRTGYEAENSLKQELRATIDRLAAPDTGSSKVK